MSLPKYLQPYLAEAKAALERGQVQDVEFSGSTYQVKVADPSIPEGAWAFLQFGQKDQLTDCLCSCDSFEEGVGCEHVTAALLKVYNNNRLPLHIRHNHSFWNHLCQILAESWAGKGEVFTRGESSYTAIPESGENFVAITPLNTEYDLFFGELLNRSSIETEETSLKFSNLSKEEIALWREGRPSAKLQYELSFWSDLAKWLMQRQEEGTPYRIDFSPQDTLPDRVEIVFPKSVKIEASITAQQWPELIPTLSSVQSNMTVKHAASDQIASITYDPKTATLHLGSLKESEEVRPLQSGHELKGWSFIPNEGFYPKQVPKRFKQMSVEGAKIGEVLSEHSSLIKTELQGAVLHDYPIFPSYHIEFTPDWDLIITTYLFEPGDLSHKESRLFGDWAYLEGDGFYRLEGKVFNEIETKITQDHINDFVRLSRAWLNTQEGFHTHVTQIETHLTYRVTEDMSLEILHQLDKGEKGDGESYHNFGEWIYIKDEGFYSTYNPLAKAKLYAGMSIPKGAVSHFIKNYKEELTHVPNFFTSLRPVRRFALNLLLDREGQITVEPVYEVDEGYHQDELLFFDDYLFIPNEGFALLPIEPNIPEKYHRVRQIRHHEMETFFEEELESLVPYTLNVPTPISLPKLVQPKILSLQRTPRKHGLLTLDLSYRSSFGVVPAYTIYQALQAKERYLLSDAGLLSLKEGKFDWLKELRQEAWNPETKQLEISPWELIKLHILDTPITPEGEALKLYQSIVGQSISKHRGLGGFQATLRPYQEVGVDWLYHLYSEHLSGLLSDDMGLGKTLQALALIGAILESEKGKKRKPKFLVVCPTSVLYHWQDKIAQFYPQLKVYTHFGSGRDVKQFDNSYDVLLTTYGIVRIDKKKFKKLSFSLAIFDEVQIAKNHASLLYEALSGITAQMRLGLTGTPIENTVRELKAIFDLVLPGYFPREESFKKRFLIPIEKDADQKATELLGKLIHPFILRRKKEEVLLELPPKVEEIAHCPLLKDQYDLYQSLLLQERDPLVKSLYGSDSKGSYIHIFSLLSKLKQICNHPASYLKTPSDYQKYRSGKWELFKELLQEARDSGQKVVVFSQFLQMLDIMELYLNQTGVGFASIRGSTKERREEIDRFQNNPSCEVFLGSLQASGLGIELTQASVVIHYDRWWNAAREDQATDRIHRMGQMRGVQVFKMVTKDSFEERIDQMIRSKAKLLSDIVGYDDQEVVKKLTKEELIYLLSDIAAPPQEDA